MRAMVVLMGAAIALASTTAQAGDTLNAIRARGELRVGTTGDYKPFTFKNADGLRWGADIAMAEDLAKSLGVKLVFVPTIWADILADQVAGKFDIAMGGVTITPPRAEQAHFSKPMFTDGKRPITRCADKEKFNGIEAINKPDVRVIVNPGGQNEKFARENLTKAQVTVHKDNATVFDEIAAGRADVMVTDGIEVEHTSRTMPGLLCPASVPAPFTTLEKAYMMPKDDELKVAVDAWLTEAQATGRWQKALDAALSQK
jgi:cyclohexadienyl dehydratase